MHVHTHTHRFADRDVTANPEWNPPPTDNVFVRGLAPGSTEADIRALFMSYGIVSAVKVCSVCARVHACMSLTVYWVGCIAC